MSKCEKPDHRPVDGTEPCGCFCNVGGGDCCVTLTSLDSLDHSLRLLAKKRLARFARFSFAASLLIPQMATRQVDEDIFQACLPGAQTLQLGIPLIHGIQQRRDRQMRLANGQ